MGTTNERTWEPLQRLLEDVPQKVTKYVDTVGDNDLSNAYDETQEALRANDITEYDADATNSTDVNRGNQDTRVANWSANCDIE